MRATLISFLWNKLKWKFFSKKKGEKLIRENLQSMMKKDQMSQLGGRLRMNQQFGKLKQTMHKVK